MVSERLFSESSLLKEDSEGVLTLKMTTTQVAETSVINDTSSNHVITFFYLDDLWLLR